MPYIKKIEVNGFKTFGKKTTLVFDKGFTAITGPNGSGKTNIIDAVLFCLGELSARRLRASNFSSLIFHGSPNPQVKKKNKAKVVIQFDNSDGRLPMDTATVTVSREIDQNGQSVYRINGRRMSRAYAMEVLSMAGISPYGHNVILQGTLTRLAEISPQERRKIIEDMIGIAQYDSEKAEAEEKLKAANISIKTAMGQVGEVQKRMESLERERNDLLRYNFIQNEIKRLDAIKVSHEIRVTQEKIDHLVSQVSNLEEKIKQIRAQREKLRLERREIETEWRKLGFEQIEENQARLLQIQIRIGELRSRVSELSTKISAGKAALDGLVRVKENTSQQIESLRKQIQEAQSRIKQLAADRDSLFEELAEIQSAYDAIDEEATKARNAFEEKTKAIREKEEQLEHLHQEEISLRSEQAESQSRINVYRERLKDLEEKKNDLNESLGRLEQSFKELQGIREEQLAQLSSLQNGLEKRKKRKIILETEIREAGKIADIAREAFVEFEARKQLIDKFKTEENALNHIEELGRLGVIPGVHGRFKNLISIEPGYERAVEAAAAGWLNSLVVEDLDAAFTCVETLRKLKLGRIKIVPLKGLTLNKQVETPKIDGLEGKVSAFVKYAAKYAPAVSFVLGDTFLVADEKAGATASRMGFRSVTVNGDLYEAGGGVESGFYRSPFDFSSFVPSDSALQALDRAVAALRNILNRRTGDIGELEKEIAETQNRITKLAEGLGKLESEIGRVEKSIKQTHLNIRRAENNLARLRGLLEKERDRINAYEKKQEEILAEEQRLQEILDGLRKGVDPSEAHEREKKREDLGSRIIVLRRKVGEIETELSTLRSNVENVLKTGLQNAVTQRDRAVRQIAILEKDIQESARQKDEAQKRIEELEKTKDELSSSLLNIKGEAQKFTVQIDDVDRKIRVLEEEYDRNDELLDELRLNLQTFRLQMDRSMEHLRSLGYEEPLDVSSERIQEVEASLRMMRAELERIGAVNQLAQKQYEEQMSRYKELSIRMNELEKEKMAIVEFIEEIERKKYNAFMEAFNKTNERLDRYFSKLTGGGNAALKLENPENPFSGGVDMVVQFVGKPPILVSGASSGERSVSAVAFLFALQEFTPASFYLLDEIDAHLDAFHVERLGELLAEEASKSQFVVVTLKPEMVSKADRIYGVYGRDGVSHVVSTTFRRAVQ